MKFEDEERIVYVKEDSYNVNLSFINGIFYSYNKKNDIWLAMYKGYVVHRENGPAIEHKDGKKQYYLNGIGCFENDYYKITKINKINTILGNI